MRPAFMQVNDVTDPELWHLAVAVVRAEFAALSPVQTGPLAALAETVRECKKALHAVVERVGVGEICASCGGQCCLTGKYHVTVVDLLVYLSGEKELFVPRFGREHCPFLGERGCLMAPAYRPLTCVIFNCELVERLLEPSERERLVQLERELRALYRRFEALFGNRFMGGVLMNCERDVVQGRGTILGKIAEERIMNGE